ncbi:MAG: hypothetical protein CVU77_01485 [Elusimicrobia bacterium HGW-Elusimicrobia-1]|jgi:hypothetical protein|nr:MAG: hypothetical protein CVU77_01485 [Elusimicrobia bacterium HGW-Elusimicrobia-1]
MTKNVFTPLALLILSAFIAPRGLAAASIATNYSDVYVDNLKIGGSYNLTATANYPMWILWKGGDRALIKVTPKLPFKEVMRAGYEPVPDISWITVSKKEFELMSDETANIDVTVNVPNDPKHLGKKYQALVEVSANPPKGSPGVSIALAVNGKILMSVAGKPPTEEELSELRRERIRARRGVIIEPERLEASVKAGGINAELTADEPLKIINSSREKVSVTIESVAPEVAGISAPSGYAKGAAKDISFSKTSASLEPDKIENIGVFLRKVPSDKSFYIVRITIKSQTLEVAKFVRVYVN